MRPLLLPFAIWVGVLQLPPANQQPITLQATATLIGAALALSGLTVSVYRLGVWRQEMHNTKHNLASENARYREEAKQQLDHMDARVSRLEKERIS